MADQQPPAGTLPRYMRRAWRVYSFHENGCMPCLDPTESIEEAVQLANAIARNWFRAGELPHFTVKPCLVLLN